MNKHIFTKEYYEEIIKTFQRLEGLVDNTRKFSMANFGRSSLARDTYWSSTFHQSRL